MHPSLALSAQAAGLTNEAARLAAGLPLLAGALTGETGYESEAGTVTGGGLIAAALSVTRQLANFATYADALTGGGSVATARSETRGSRFAGVVGDLLAGKVLRRSWLVRLDFASGTQRYWLGGGRLYAGSEFWEGLGDLVSLSDIDLSPGTSQDAVTLTLSGVSTAALYALTNHATEVRGRRVVLYQQWFDEALQPIGEPYARWAGTGDKLSGRRTADKATITLVCESILVAKYLPAYGMYTDHDQQALYPGDKGLEHMAQNEDKEIPFP